MSHLWIHRNAVRLRHARSPRWAPAEGPAIHQDLGMECPLKKEGFSYTYVWNHLKSWWYLCGAHRFCELLWHFFGVKFVLIDQVEPHLVESPHRPTSESVCFRLLAKRCFFITYSMATFSNIVISSEPQFPFHPKHPGGAWSLQVMSSQLGKTQRFVLGRGITSSFWHGTWEVHGLGKQTSLTSLNFGTLCFGACKSWRATRCCIFSAPVNLYNPTNRVLHIGLHGRDDRLLKWHEVKVLMKQMTPVFATLQKIASPACFNGHRCFALVVKWLQLRFSWWKSCDTVTPLTSDWYSFHMGAQLTNALWTSVRLTVGILEIKSLVCQKTDSRTWTGISSRYLRTQLLDCNLLV